MMRAETFKSSENNQRNVPVGKISDMVQEITQRLNEDKSLSEEEIDNIRGLLDSVYASLIRIEGENTSLFNDEAYKLLQTLLPDHQFFHDASQYTDHLRLLSNGQEAFDEIRSAIRSANSSIEIQMFVWRNDKTGREFVDLLLEKAKQGVQIRISKDAIGMIFEQGEAPFASMFHTHSNTVDYDELQNQAVALKVNYAKEGQINESSYPPLQELLSMDNVHVHSNMSQHDHTKYYIIDERDLYLGDMNIGDEYREDWRGFMIAAPNSPYLVKKFKARRNGEDDFDHGQAIEFGLNRFGIKENSMAIEQMEIASIALNLISGAKDEIILEMAYFGDPRITDALIKAIHRGVKVQIILPEQANIQQDLNMSEVSKLMRAARRCHKTEKLRIYLYPGMTHAKVLHVDQRVSFMGSANYNFNSLNRLQESNFLIDDPDAEFTIELGRQLRLDIKKSRVLTETPEFNAVVADFEQMTLNLANLDALNIPTLMGGLKDKSIEVLINLINPLDLANYSMSIFNAIETKDNAKLKQTIHKLAETLLKDYPERFSQKNHSKLSAALEAAYKELYTKKVRPLLQKYAKLSTSDVLKDEVKSVLKFIGTVVWSLHGDERSKKELSDAAMLVERLFSEEIEGDLTGTTLNLMNEFYGLAQALDMSEDYRENNIVRNFGVALIFQLIGFKGLSSVKTIKGAGKSATLLEVGKGASLASTGAFVRGVYIDNRTLRRENLN